MYKFSQSSLRKLEECDIRLQCLAHAVMRLQLFDFGISCGHRGETEQNHMVEEGTSTKTWPDGKHNSMPSNAYDFFLLLDTAIDWKQKKAWYMAVGVFRGVASMLGIPIRVGADWDGDFDTEDQELHDLPHVELIIN